MPTDPVQNVQDVRDTLINSEPFMVIGNTLARGGAALRSGIDTVRSAISPYLPATKRPVGDINLPPTKRPVRKAVGARKLSGGR